MTHGSGWVEWVAPLPPQGVSPPKGQRSGGVGNLSRWHDTTQPGHLTHSSNTLIQLVLFAHPVGQAQRNRVCQGRNNRAEGPEAENVPVVCTAPGQQHRPSPGLRGAGAALQWGTPGEG